MSIKMSVAVRNAKLDAIETAIGVSAVLKIRSGSVPTNIADADSGTVLATMSLPSDWMAAASNGSKAKNGTWQDLSADSGGVAAHFRVYDSGVSVCHIQGTVSASGGGGDLVVSDVNFSAGQSFTINTFTITDGNA
jgi:hypothetical protein